MKENVSPMMSCSHCGATFLSAERCPSCMRSSGLVRPNDTPQAGHQGGGFGPVVLVLLVIGVGIWWWASASEAPVSEPGTARSAPSAGASALESVPADLRLKPQAVGGSIQLVADRLPREASALVGAVVAARKTGKLPTRGDADDLLGAPRSAASLAGALDDEQSLPAGPFEAATLAGALLSARLGPGASYGFDPDAPGTATNLLERRYVVRHKEGDWLALDEGPITTVETLSEAAVLANALALRSLSALLEDDADLASRASQQARALAPQDPAIVFTAGQVQLATGLVDMGLSTMERAAGLKSDAQTWVALGVAAMHGGKPFKAHQYLQKAVTADPTRAEPHLGLAQLALERLAITPRSGQGEVIAEVERHIAAGEAAEPGAAGLGALKAQVAVLAGDKVGAERLLREETQRHASDPMVWLNLAQFLEGEDRSADALAALQDGAGKARRSAPLYQALGAVLAEAGRFDEGLAALEEALVIDPSDRELRPQLAQIHHARGNIPAARALLEDQLTNLGDDWTAKLLLTQLEMDDGKLPVAREHVDGVLKAQPDHPEATLIRYALAIRSGEPLGRFRADAIRVIGSRTEVAQVLLEQGFPDEGERLLREAMEMRPEDGLAPVLLGAVLVATDREAEAQRVKKDALESAADAMEREKMALQFDAAFEQARAARRERAAAPTAP